MDETKDSQMMEAAHCEVEAQLEAWVDYDDEAMLDVMSARAVAWCQAIAGFVMPMQPDEEIQTILHYDGEGVTISVRRGGSSAH